MHFLARAFFYSGESVIVAVFGTLCCATVLRDLAALADLSRVREIIGRSGSAPLRHQGLNDAGYTFASLLCWFSLWLAAFDPRNIDPTSRISR